MTTKEQQQVDVQRRQQSELGHYDLLMSGPELATLFTERDELQALLSLDVTLRKACKAERDELRAALDELMPFVLETYYPTCATPEFKHAVERAKKVLGQ